MELTNHQNAIANKVLLDIYKVLSSGGNPFVSLTGMAGSGKTTVTQHIIDILSEDYSIKATAPTHKATKVLAKNLVSIEASTIHSFLKLKLKPDFNTGLQILIEDWGGPKSPRPENVDILVVDEGSMISTEMFEHIQNAVDKGRMKVVLFVGDSMQLKPVEGNGDSIYNRLHSHELTAVVRQAQGNPIIKESTWIRSMIEAQNFLPIDKLFNSSKDKITVYTDRSEFLNSYLNNPSEDKVVCTFTNAVVDQYNHFIRGRLKGTNIPYIVQGDLLIFQDSLSKGDRMVYSNNDVVEVYACDKRHDTKLGINYWHISVKDEEPFEIVDIESMGTWNEHLGALKENANKESDKYKKKTLWAYYFNTANRFGNVKYVYASTLHKLQGSTYEDVYFDFSSLKKHTHDMDNVYRLIYVALTRASDSIKILR